MQPFEMLSEHQEIPRPFSFAIYGAVDVDVIHSTGNVQMD